MLNDFVLKLHHASLNIHFWFELSPCVYLCMGIIIYMLFCNILQVIIYNILYTLLFRLCPFGYIINIKELLCYLRNKNDDTFMIIRK